MEKFEICKGTSAKYSPAGGAIIQDGIAIAVVCDAISMSCILEAARF
jgi:hypothetical protein